MNPFRPLLRIRPRVLPAYRITSHRALSLTPRLLGLQITNPRADPTDPSATMSIVLTPRASSRLQAIQTRDSNPLLALRVTVESGGCHGFQYTISLSDKVNPAEDSLFTDEETGARVVLDEPSLELLKGSTVDYTQELIGSQFVVKNPLATSSCGCGTSFDIAGL
ncbi:hypothetical protein BZA05DRAFT_119818 [Tricharina praecox]|uniref:uncharacterized protein n=1 Tax=Tricharina praecox TaxID=43433 RepID=UPI00221F5AAC|nr:uncharacterized protein BZA05DRAFT_119818 [Tricharina praecox]KAI5848095.1 hypothetical protein BZA05DRAFT_119818 [Tricharina praecox]